MREWIELVVTCAFYLAWLLYSRHQWALQAAARRIIAETPSSIPRAVRSLDPTRDLEEASWLISIAALRLREARVPPRNWLGIRKGEGRIAQVEIGQSHSELMQALLLFRGLRDAVPGTHQIADRLERAATALEMDVDLVWSFERGQQADLDLARELVAGAAGALERELKASRAASSDQT